jgi:hypothetical protein
MRPNQQNNKQRSRGRNNNNQRRGGGGGGNPLSRNYESNGPDVKIRGNAAHIAEKYVQLARDATSVGDNVMAENYLQHAEHYFRIILAAQAQYQPRQDQMIDTTADEGDDEEVAVTNGAAELSERAPEAQEAAAEGEEQPRQRRQRRPRRERIVEGAEAAADTEPQAEAAPAPAAEANAEDEAPKRARRPRRKKTDSEDDGPAPELPAFLTAGREAAAE